MIATQWPWSSGSREHVSAFALRIRILDRMVLICDFLKVIDIIIAMIHIIMIMILDIIMILVHIIW